MSVCPSLCLSFPLSVLPSVYPSLCLSFPLSVLPSVCPSLCLSNRLLMTYLKLRRKSWTALYHQNNLQTFMNAVWPDWAKFRHLGHFLHNQCSPKQAVSTHGLFKSFKSSLMWMFWAFNLSFDVDISIFWATFFKHYAIFFSIFWSHCMNATKNHKYHGCKISFLHSCRRL